jgi:hypothetical protein
VGSKRNGSEGIKRTGLSTPQKPVMKELVLMKIFKAVIVFLLMCLIAIAQSIQMTNADVLQMVRGKISPDVIILAISKCEPHFQLDLANVDFMLRNGVT